MDQQCWEKIRGETNFRQRTRKDPFEESEVAQSCPTLCYCVDCSQPGSSVHGILQARILEWVAISFSRGSSPPRDWTQVSRIAGRRFWGRSIKVEKCRMKRRWHFDVVNSSKKPMIWRYSKVRLGLNGKTERKKHTYLYMYVYNLHIYSYISIHKLHGLKQKI